MQRAERNGRATRRQLVLGTLGGAVAGGIWGAAVQTLASPSRPTISMVGRASSQVALIDTTRVRALVLLGLPDDDLIAMVPRLLTLVRQRIDILIGAASALERLPRDFAARWHVAHTFFVPEGNRDLSMLGRRSAVAVDLDLDAGDDCVLTIRRSARDAWRSDAPERALWAVSVRCGSTTATLAPDALSAKILASPHADLVAVPSGDVTQNADFRLSHTPVAMNADQADTVEVPGVRIVRVFPDDVARFVMESDRMELPAWAGPHTD